MPCTQVNRTLTGVSLRANDLDSEVADALASCLKVIWTHDLLQHAAYHWQENTDLQYLDLSENQLGPSGAAGLAEGLKVGDPHASALLHDRWLRCRLQVLLNDRATRR